MSPEHKPDPDDEAPTTKPKVTWKGIVDVPIDAPTGRKEKLMAQMSGIGSGSGSGHLFTRRRKWALAALAIIAVVGVVLMSSLHTVSAGTVAVPVTLGSAETPLDEGLHLTPPWPITDLNTMSVQTQNYTMTAADTKGTDDPVLVLGLDGASATVQATLLYSLDPNRASDVYREVGTDFDVKLVQPTARSCIRTEFANYDMVLAATGSLDEVQAKVRSCIADKIEPRGIDLQDLQIREVTLGDQVQTAIDAKVSAQQDAERQVFELDRAQQQAEIARVNASGTADAQQILACGGSVQPSEQDGISTQVIVPNPPERCNPAQLSSEVLYYNYIQMLREVLKGGGNTVILGGDGTTGVLPTIDAAPTTTAP